MWITQTYAQPSRADNSGDAMSFQMSGEAHRPAVKLHATILESAAYARAMLALFEVVKSDGRFKAKDHSAYQEWVRAEYLRELAPQLEAQRRALPGQIKERDELRERIKTLEKEAAPHRHLIGGAELWEAKRRYWKWLYSRDHALWMILDPVVSVHPDAVIFEVFSQDESSYGRVTVAQQNLQTEGEVVYGTTNVDFSEALANEIRRVRPYRPAKLGVEGGGVAISTDAGSRLEKKIDLPPSWVRGFLQVQSAATLPAVEVSLSSSLVADILEQLRRQREKFSPRSIKFILQNGERPRVILEPWGIELQEQTHVYNGDSQEIRIWGRRRLLALEGLLPHAETIQVRLLGTGMPSFWSAESKGHRFDIGLSGWTKNDWSSAARFDLLAATAPVTAGDIELARGQLENALKITPDELAARSDLSREAATAALQQLCKDGDAMFDSIGGFYRWRKLLPPGAEAAAGPRDPRLEYAKRIVAAGGIKWQKVGEDDEFRRDQSGETTRLSAQVSGINDLGSTRNERKFDVLLDVNADGRVSFAQCSCSEFRRDKLKKGPCAHILATSALASSQVAGAKAARASGETKSSGGIDPTRFKDLTFCFTGALSIYSRDQAESLVAQSGGKAASGVSKGLNYLVAGERAGSKLIKAKLLGVKVISEADFKKLLEGETI
ncbi:MAG TPA: BRCT domain-containing protein [Abditibacterium sp.]|jgi:hypothetical protein